MSSTGEVGCLGDDFEEALLKALNIRRLPVSHSQCVAFHRPLGRQTDVSESARLMQSLGISFMHRMAPPSSWLGPAYTAHSSAGPRELSA